MGLFRKCFLDSLLALSAISFSLVGCAGTNERLDWDLGTRCLAFQEKTGWIGINGDETLRKIYAKQGETSENWTEKVEVTVLPIAITFGSKTRWNPESIMLAEKGRKQCPTDMWTVLQKDQSSILYEWKDISCPGYHHQYEIVRIVMGRWYLWMISYGVKNKDLLESEREILMESLLKAKVALD
jgi:hypothetical protein